MFSWALGSSMAAVAGIFLAEELATLDVQTLTLLILAAFAAAIIGRLKSLPLTFAGGLLIGLVFEFQQNFLSWTGRWTTAPVAIPQIMLFLALLFLPQARIEGKKAIRQVAPRIPKLRTAAFGMVVLFVVVVVGSLIADRVGTRQITLAVLTMLIMVSLVPLTGWSKQISLAQITFVGAGAFAYLQWSPDLGSGLGMIVAALFAVPFGVAMALPALRLQGLYLALASMAFAQMAAILFFPQPEILGFDGKPIGPIEIFGFDFSQPFDFLGIHFGQDVGTLFFITAAVGVVGVLSCGCTRAAFGRRLTALGDSPAACATLGINPIVTKLSVFVISAGIAGFAGALLGIFQGTATVQDFEMLAGLGYLLLLVVGGVAVVSGAVFGGFNLQLFTLSRAVAGQHVRHCGSRASAPASPVSRSGASPRVSSPRWARTSAPRTRASGRPASRPRAVLPAPPRPVDHRRRQGRRRATPRPRRSGRPAPDGSAAVELGEDLGGVLAHRGRGADRTSSSNVTAGRGCSISPSSGAPRARGSPATSLRSGRGAPRAVATLAHGTPFADRRATTSSLGSVARCAAISFMSPAELRPRFCGVSRSGLPTSSSRPTARSRPSHCGVVTVIIAM